MTSLRKRDSENNNARLAYGSYGRRKDTAPPQAFGYDSDVSEEAIRDLEAASSKVMTEADWEVIDGYVGRK